MGMAFDATRGQVVLFGGRTTSQIFDDTWTWNGTDWTQQHPAHSPPPLAGLQLAYDAVRQQIVLFGGGPDLTWTWNGTDWTEQHPANAPFSRTGFGMATDPLGGVVLFGGDDGDDFLGDTWTWDGTDWNQRSPAHAPKARSGVSMALDQAHGRVVLFAGRRFNDTWTVRQNFRYQHIDAEFEAIAGRTLAANQRTLSRSIVHSIEHADGQIDRGMSTYRSAPLAKSRIPTENDPSARCTGTRLPSARVNKGVDRSVTLTCS